MQDDGKRYITLLGERPHASLTARFMAAADIKVAALSVAALALYAKTAGGGQAGFWLALAIASGGASLCLMRGYLENTLLFGGDGIIHGIKLAFGRDALERKAIDRRPDPEIAACSRETYRQQIRFTKEMYMAGAFGPSFVAAVCGVVAAGTGIPPVGFVTIAVAAAIVRTVQGAYRFNKLAKGEWAIVDMPAEKETKQAPASTAPHPV